MRLGWLGTGCRAEVHLLRGSDRGRESIKPQPLGQDAARGRIRAKGTIFRGTSRPGLLVSESGDGGPGQGEMLEAKWETETAGRCLTQEAEGGKDEAKCVVFSRDQSEKEMRLFCVPEVSLRGQPPCMSRGEPQAVQDLHLRLFVERGSL